MNRSIVLLVSLSCNLRCPYCFAESTMGPSGFMTYETFKKIVSFVTRGVKRGEWVKIRLAGGEPTLNPDFKRMLGHLRKMKSVRVNLLTNGIFGPDILKELNLFEPESLTLLVNVNDPGRIGRKRYSIIRKNLEKLSSYRVTVGINFYSHKNRYRYIVDLAKKRGFRVRWSLTHPIGGDHLYVSPAEFKRIRPLVLKFLKECADNNIPVVSDCSTPLCILDGKLDFIPELSPGSTFCNPPVVVDPKMNVFLCYEEDESRLGSFRSAAALFRHYEKAKERRGKYFWLPDCRTCCHGDYKRCGGGCPHHEQHANDFDIDSLGPRDLKGVGFHLSTRFRAYRRGGKEYYLKDLGGGDGFELDAFMYDLMEGLRKRNDKNLSSVYRAMRKAHGNLSVEEFLDLIEHLVVNGFVNVWMIE